MFVSRCFCNANADLCIVTGTLKGVCVVTDVHVVDFAVQKSVDLCDLWQSLEDDRLKHWLVAPPLAVTLNRNCARHFVKCLELKWTTSHEWRCLP